MREQATKRNEQELREFLFKYYKSKQYFLDMSLFKRHLEYLLCGEVLDYHIYNSDLNKVSVEFSFETVDYFIVESKVCFDVYSDRYVFRSYEVEKASHEKVKEFLNKRGGLRLV